MAAGGGIQLGLLGPLAAWRDGVELPLGGSKQRAVLGVLALERGRTVTTDALIEALWPAQAPGRPQTAIQGYVSQLRKALGPETIVTEANGYRLDAAPEQLDSAEFERRLAVAPKLAPLERAAELAAALALWRGPALTEFMYDVWAQATAARLEELRLVALEARLDADLECGHGAELVGELEALVRDHPLRERLRGQLMLALYRAGRQAEALDAYAAARAALVDELGIDPGAELQLLHRSILNQDVSLAAAPHQVSPTVRLPVPLTSLVGRDDDRARLVRLLGQEGARLVTLTGPGGMGKTRLAIQAAGDLAGAFADGVWFVELASLREAEHVIPAIAATLDATGELVAHIGDRRLLLVLDNFEQVLEAAPAVAHLLRSCPNLALLVTSREHLHLTGEIEHALAGLPPGVAAELFAERAGRVGVELDATDDEIAELCVRLDGLPLAIELAAARTKLFSPDDLLARLGSRLEVLRDGPVDAPERHRTLAATIDWSHALLGEAERELFESLAVFASSFELPDVEAVLPADLETLAALVDKSLVARTSETGSFGLLATVREFAASRLDGRADADAIRRRHAEHVLAVVADADERAAGPDEVAALAEIARRHDDIRAALDWAEAAQDGDLALGLVAAAGWFWYVRGHLVEGRRRLEAALVAAGSEQTALRATAYMRAGAIADALIDLPAAERFYRAALAIRRELGDGPGEFGALNNLGNLALQAGDYAAARLAHEEGLALARELDDRGAIASALHNLALDHLVADDAAGALPLLEESRGHAEELGTAYGLANVHASLGAALVSLGDLVPAAAHLAESVRLLRTLDATEALPQAVEDLAALALATGDPEAAARRLGAAMCIRAGVGSGTGRIDVDRAGRTEAEARRELGDGAFDRFWSEGRELTLAQAIELVSSEAAAAVPARG